MYQRSRQGSGNRLITVIALLTAFWTTYKHGGTFYALSAPRLADMVRQSELWLWTGLIIDLWFIVAWVVYFVIAATSIHLLLSLIVGWVLTLLPN